MTVGGFFNAGISITSQDLDTNTRGHALDREAEIIFKASSMLDEGGILQEVGVVVELEAESLGDQIDETYMFLNGAFGQLRIGQDDGAMQNMGVYPASAGLGGYGVVFCTFSHVGGADGGCNVGEGAFGLGPDYDSEKVGWYSPRVGGASIAFSYTPENGEATGGGSPQNSVANNEEGEQSEVFGIGANWTGEFAGGNVTLGGGYSRASLEAPSADGITDSRQTEWIIGASVTMMDITVSGNYSVDDGGQSTVKDRTTFALGATTGSGPWKYGVTLANTERATSDNTAFSFGARYSLGGGVTIAGELQFWDIDAVDNTMDNQATVALIGTMVNF
jgi:predicted porin